MARGGSACGTWPGTRRSVLPGGWARTGRPGAGAAAILSAPVAAILLAYFQLTLVAREWANFRADNPSLGTDLRWLRDVFPVVKG